VNWFITIFSYYFDVLEGGRNKNELVEKISSYWKRSGNTEAPEAERSLIIYIFSQMWIKNGEVVHEYQQREITGYKIATQSTLRPNSLHII